MTTGDKAKRATVAIGPLSVDGFQMPDGSYRMSQAQIAECIGTTPQNASNFLRSKAFKALRGRESTDQSFESIEVESAQQTTGGTRINAVPLDVVWAFWLYQCSRGGQRAYQLLAALGLESLERHFDAAFGVERSESDRNALLAQRLQQTEADLAVLGEAYALPDVLIEDNERLRAENQVLRDQVQELGGQPGQPPGFPPS
ncbi:hypothetical protein [Nodosilinea sp. E11]|uniref:hypothetical protein n=1 Tax=Nodosilinea sp. E11 TaxID=3037479 RepID=UPI0029349FDB|nr:hypothetical protein [Nodosilinea sp. E11]WOD37346.1 hypothetical protein RRF56_02515 [Nodosilinea sp. E11]